MLIAYTTSTLLKVPMIHFVVASDEWVPAFLALADTVKEPAKDVNIPELLPV
ncbi:MAG: hypothetical protein ABIV21_09705 [Pyrinomonadaceae bacterium]